MTAEEFKQGYSERSGITVEEFDQVLIVLPCDCGEEGCQGWQARVKPRVAARQEKEDKR